MVDLTKRGRGVRWFVGKRKNEGKPGGKKEEIPKPIDKKKERKNSETNPTR